MLERRRDLLSGEWRVVATARQDRTFLPGPDECPLCPTRPGGPTTEIDAPAFDVVVFPNRWPPFVADPPEPSTPTSALFPVAPAAGAAEVVVYSDRHDATLADLGPGHIALVVDAWADRYAALGARPDIAYVFVFENRGEAVGVTLHHPHGQIYGYPEIPPIPRRELERARRHGSCLVCELVGAGGERVVAANRGFVASVPFAPRFPYEMHVTARRHVPSIVDLTADERRDLAAQLDVVVRTYDGLFGFALPYVMSLHQAPTDGGDWSDVSHFRIEFTPLHRSADKRKYLAGSELHAGTYLVDVAPEDAAAALRAVLA